MVLYIKKRIIVMPQVWKPLALGLAIIALGALAIVDIVPEQFAQFGPILLLALFPGAWLTCGMRREGCC
jgi:hypothetical protein